VKIVLSSLVALAVLVAAPAFAAPPETVTLKASQGDVTFNHKAHQKQGCKTCHGAGAPGKIELNKDSAHKLCIDCHKEKGASATPPAPTKCNECHKKA
jgi:predicted CXXCH cytochrome family protein